LVWHRLPQIFQNIAHYLCPVFGIGKGALNAQFFVAGELDVLVFLDQLDDLHRIQHPQAVHVDQCLCLRRQLAKAVDDFFQQGVDLVGGFGRGELFVDAQSQVHVTAQLVQLRQAELVGAGHHKGAGSRHVDAVSMMVERSSTHQSGVPRR
jgi:hypothetical protein